MDLSIHGQNPQDGQTLARDGIHHEMMGGVL